MSANPEKLEFEKIVRRYGQKPAIIAPSQSISYQLFGERVRQIAALLASRGVSPGRHVAIWAGNSPQTVLAIWAIWYAGAVAVPLSTRFPRKQIERLLEELSCTFLWYDEEHKEEAAALGIDLMCIADADHTSFPEKPLRADQGNFLLSQPATIILTSGSSGSPRAAVHSMANHYYSALGSAENIPLDRSSRWLLSLPLYHVGGLAILMRCFLAGAAVAVPAAGTPLDKSLPALSPTHLSLVPAQLSALLDDDIALRCLQQARAVLLGGSAIPDSVLLPAWKAGLPLHTSYGSTEMSSQICTTPPGADLAVLRTSGRVLPQRELRISGDGEIQVRGRTRFRGYWRDGMLEAPFDPDGWFASGDCGYVDENGNLVVTGRIDNMFISGGENIHPEEIERVLQADPQIRLAVVVAVPHQRFGERPVAFVESQSGTPPDGAALRARLRELLPAFKIPDHFFNWPSDLSGAGLKIDRKKFRRRALALLKRGECEDAD